MLTKWGVTMWAGFIRLRKGSSGGLLYTRYGIMGFYLNRLGIYSVTRAGNGLQDNAGQHRNTRPYISPGRDPNSRFQCMRGQSIHPKNFNIWKLCGSYRKNRLKLSHTLRAIKSRSVRWGGGVMRIGYYMLAEKPEGKRSHGRPRRKWEGVRMWAGFNWLRNFSDRLLWTR